MDYLMFIVLIISGIFLIYLSVANILTEKFGKKFLSAKGVITKSEKYETVYLKPFDDESAGVMYGITIKYEYVYDGVSYQNCKIHRDVTSEASSGGGDIYGLKKKYPVNKEVIVFVNPEDHSDAYLDNKPKVMYLLFFIGLMLCISGVFVKLIF